MRKIFIVMFVILAFLVLCIEAVFAGGSQTEGQGARPISMGGAFIAVADGPEAVFYNPAGLTQMEKAEVSAGALVIFPKNKYQHSATGVKQTSDKFALGPNAFIGIPVTPLPIVNSLYFGFGMYSPFARDAHYGSDDPGFGNLSATTVRVDYSPTLACRLGEEFSVGAGFIAAQGKSKQKIQTAYGNNVYVIDKDLEGWGYSWLVGALYKPHKMLKIGGVYRGSMGMTQDGHREQTFWTERRDISSNINYPATAGIGIAFMPIEQLTFAFDADWNGWSLFYDVDTHIEGMPDSITIVNAHDTIDYRFGLEVKPDKTTALRCGFMYIPAATPSEYILPQKPDYEHTYAFTFGASKAWKDLTFGLLYEYTWSNEWDVSDNTYGYNGIYKVNAHTIGADVKFRF